MRRASYRHAVAWIAENDEPQDLREDAVAYYCTSLLVADIFGLEPERVGRAVVRYRKSQIKADEKQRQEAPSAPPPRRPKHAPLMPEHRAPLEELAANGPRPASKFGAISEELEERGLVYARTGGAGEGVIAITDLGRATLAGAFEPVTEGEKP